MKTLIFICFLINAIWMLPILYGVGELWANVANGLMAAL
jgi:hypothetical protein